MFTLEDIVEELIGDVRDEFEASREVSIADAVRASSVLLDPPAADKTDLIDRLVRAACEGVETIDPAVAKDAVLRRERAVPSSVAGSFALPHARVPGLRESRGAVARIKDGIDFQAPDGRPVRLVLLILAPDTAAPGTLARFLRKAAGLIESDFIRSRLLNATTPDEVKEILRVGETSVSV
jgi:mannitol/fructose-specific phosphotransferase system IIA component (Ntr-type)